MKRQERPARGGLRASAIAAFLVVAPACSSGVGPDDVVTCPVLIPLGPRSSCNYPETPIGRRYEYGCGYSLPCGERMTCTCVPDQASWVCDVDCADGTRQACEF